MKVQTPILLTGFFILLIAVQGVLAQDGLAWQDKVHQTVFERLSENDQVEVLIELREKADLSAARWLSSKSEKGTFVFRELDHVATTEQSPIIFWLRSSNIPHRSFRIINAIWARCDREEIEYLARLGAVEKIQYNIKLQREVNVDEETLETRSPESVEWGVAKINADDVWDLGYNGSGVVIGGQDTGYDWDHEALIDTYRGWDGSSADHNYNWHDAIHEIDPGNSGPNPCGLDSPVPCDDHYHGTHTMGTMVGTDGGNGIGVAPGAQWIGCRNMERGDGTPATYLECFEWFLAPTNLAGENPNPTLAPHVINNSWACPPSEGCDSGYDFSSMETAIENLRSAGVVVVASAGNEGSACSSVENPPAFYDASFSVGATNSNDDIASFSSRGPSTYSSMLKPNVSAPGVSVYSSEPDDNYGTHSGTSMAGPHVAGAVALLISAAPELAGDVEQIENLLESTAVPLTTTQNCGGVLGSEVPNNTYGYGRIDVLAAVNMAQGELALDIVYFEGKATSSGNLLSWSITGKENEKYFEIEKSLDRKNWVPLGYVELNDQNSFEFLDPAGINPIDYYRLKIVDQDGAFRYSKLVSVYRLKKQDLMLFPNPVESGQFRLFFSGAINSTIQMDILNMQGAKVLSRSFQLENAAITPPVPTSQLPKGIYSLRATDLRTAYPLGQVKLVIQ